MQSTLQESAPDAPWVEMSPLLDEAMSHLGAGDRDVLVLRYFQNKSLSEMGVAMGLEERTAQKRVTRALEKLRKIFAQNGVTLSGAAIASAVAANSAQAAPVGLAAIISTAALSGKTSTTTALIAATKAIAMTTLQKALIATTLAFVAGAGIYEAHQAAQLRGQNQMLQQQQASLAGQIQQLKREHDDSTNQLASLEAENKQLESNPHATELLKLHGEVTQLKTAANQKENDPTDAAMKAWMARVNQLKQYANQNPNAKIPELQLMSDQDWLTATTVTKQGYTNETGVIESEDDYRRAMAQVRDFAESKFVGVSLKPALIQYEQANKGQFPTSISGLQPYFSEPVDDDILQRYEILPATQFPEVQSGGDSVITEKAPIDSEFDFRIILGANGGYTSIGPASFGAVQ